MNEYEVMYITKAVEEKELNIIVDKINKLIENNGGTVAKIDRWGKKRLAYEIEGNQEGLYVLTAFRGTQDTVKELNRVIKITENVLRHMIIRK